MAPVAKPNLLTRKLGPAPVWLWAAAALTVAFVLLRSSGAANSTVLPSSSTSSGGAQPPASGQGTPADNMNSDQLSALLGNLQASTDALLQAVQSTNAHGAGGGGTVGGGSGDSSGATGDSAAAPANNAPPGSTAQGEAAGPAYVAVPSGAGSDYVLGFTYQPISGSASAGLAGTEVSAGQMVGSVGTTGTSDQSGVLAAVDPSGHVINQKGARVGGFADY